MSTVTNLIQEWVHFITDNRRNDRDTNLRL